VARSAPAATNTSDRDTRAAAAPTGYALKDEIGRKLDLTKPVTAWARLATGETIRSKPQPLMRAD